MWQRQVEHYFGQHPDAEIILSQPGLGPILGARVLAEFGDAEHSYASAKSRRNYAGTSPITGQSGKKKQVLARYVHNDRLIDALSSQALSALSASRRAGLLRQPARPRRRALRRPASTRQPPRRHPPRMPQNPHPIRRNNRLDKPGHEARGLTPKPLGCLSPRGSRLPPTPGTARSPPKVPHRHLLEWPELQGSDQVGSAIGSLLRSCTQPDRLVAKMSATRPTAPAPS